LIAAYAVALQLVLSAFAAVAPLAPDAGPLICRGGDRNAPAEPAAHDPCGACLAHCAGAVAAPDRDTVAVTWPSGARHVSASFATAAPAGAMPVREQSARAPPRV
jgi:hypothetical protein